MLIQTITFQKNVEVMTNPILREVGIFTIKAEIDSNYNPSYFMFGNPIETIPQPLHPEVQKILDDFKIEVQEQILLLIAP